MNRHVKHTSGSPGGRLLLPSSFLHSRLLIAIPIFVLESFLLSAQSPRFTNDCEAFANANTIPLGLSQNRKTEHHILPHEFTGAPSGAIIRLYLRRASNQTATTTYTNLTIRMAQASATAFSGNQFRSSGLTTVLSAPSFSVSPGGIDTWIPFDLPTPFPYDPSLTLVIQICQAGTAGGAVSLRTDAGTGSVSRRIFGAGCASTSGTADHFAYAFGIDLDNGNTAPTALCTDVTVPATENCSGVASIDNGSFDPDNDPITSAQLPPGPYPLGTTGVTLVVTDSRGASSTCQASVTVVDDVPPVVRTKNVTLPLSPSGLAKITPDMVNDGSSDNCGIAAITVSPTVFTCSDVGEREVLMTVTDDAGNTAGATATVTITDVTPPAMEINPVPLTLWPPQHQYVAVETGQCVRSLTDVCDGAPSLVISSITSDESDDDRDVGDGNTVNDIVIAPDCKSVMLRSERDNRKDGRTYRIRLRATDQSGNATEGIFTVMVPHDQYRPAIRSTPVFEVVSACGVATLHTMPVNAPPPVELGENFPDPFNPSTTIAFDVKSDSRVRLSVSDRFGRTLTVLADEFFTAGRYLKTWVSDSSTPSGVYFATILAHSTDGRETYSSRTMILMK